MQKGANAGAMPAWKNRLSTNELVLVASYVASLRGSNPAVAKTAEGNVIDPWPEPPAKTDESEQASTPAADDANPGKAAGSQEKAAE